MNAEPRRARRFRPMLVGAAILAAITAVPAAAATYTFSPGSIDTTDKVSPALDPASYFVTDDYDAFGVWFGDGGVRTAIFRDPPLAWGGVDDNGFVDLFSPVGAKVVVPGTGGTSGRTSHLSVEGGNAAVGSLLLEAYDCAGNLIGSTVNDDGAGPNDNTLMTLDLPGIHSFRVSTPVGDTFGVDSIEMDDPTPCVTAATIDIKPGSNVNPINLGSKGVIPVAILTTPGFDAATVDVPTVRFEGARAANRGALEDVDTDGDLDRMLQFRTQDTSIAAGATKACLTGTTKAGAPISSCDTITIVPK